MSRKTVNMANKVLQARRKNASAQVIDLLPTRVVKSDGHTQVKRRNDKGEIETNPGRPGRGPNNEIAIVTRPMNPDKQSRLATRFK